jgi:hypothetical protein
MVYSTWDLHAGRRREKDFHFYETACNLLGGAKNVFHSCKKCSVKNRHGQVENAHFCQENISNIAVTHFKLN